MKITITNVWSNPIPFPEGKSILLNFDTVSFKIKFHGGKEELIINVYDPYNNDFLIPNKKVNSYSPKLVSLKSDEEKVINITIEFI